MAKALPVILGLLAAGAAGAIVAFAAGSSAPPPSGDSTEVTRLRSEIDTMRREMDDLRDEMSRLRETALAARSLPGAAPVATALGEEADVPAEAGGEEVAAAPLNPQDPKLVEAVKTAVAEEQRKRQEAMGERFAAMAKARESSLLDRLVEEHGVTPYQRGEMEKLLERRRQAIGEMFRTMFSGQEGGQPQDFMKIREKMGEIRQETDQEIQALLSAPQYEAFKAEDRMGGPGFMRGGGGGGRGR